MKQLNLEAAGEFLVLASTFTQIKARQLLPSQVPSSEDDGPDPAKEREKSWWSIKSLKKRLNSLENNFEKFKDNFYKSAPVFDSGEKALNLQIFELLAAVRRAFDQLEERQHADLLKMEEFPIDKKIEKVLNLLAGRQWLLLLTIFLLAKQKNAV